MILQPLVENSIKHGLAPKIEGGSITLRSRVHDGMVVIEVEDDGVGMMPGGAEHAGSGIGMANVKERLNVLYGDAAKMEIDSQRGKGTLVRITIPVPQSDEPGSAYYEVRSSSPR